MTLVRAGWLGALVMAVLSAATPAAAAPVRGVALGLFAEDAGWSYRPLLDEIAAAGADHVELVVPWYQADAASTAIVDHPRYTPTIKQFASVIAWLLIAGFISVPVAVLLGVVR